MVIKQWANFGGALPATFFGVTATALVLLIVPPRASPFEDAAMLMRYSQHLASGYGIVWNIGEAPLDGATDFLFMILVAVTAAAGIGVERAVISLDLAAHALTVAFVFYVVLQEIRAGALTAFICALIMAFGPGLFLTSIYFGTPVFALSVSVAWWLSLRAVTEPSWRRSAQFAIGCLIMGLVRPEGVLVAGLLFLAAAFYKPDWAAKYFISFASAFGTFGLAYFVWRWSYFGHPLPNPFYVKGSGAFHLDGLKASVQSGIHFTGIFAIFFLPGIFSKHGIRRLVYCGIPLAGYVAMWGLLSSEMNHLRRFQYPLLPMIMMSWPFVSHDFLAWLHEARARLVFGATAMIVVSSLSAWSRFGSYLDQTAGFPRVDVNEGIGVRLARFAPQGYTLATTEAGVLPFYSRWKSIDCWGLNDRFIAEYGEVTGAYLSRYTPDLIMFHSPREAPPYDPQTDMFGLGTRWARMVNTLHDYAVANAYILAAEIPSPWGGAYRYYVKQDTLHRREIVDAIVAS